MTKKHQLIIKLAIVGACWAVIGTLRAENSCKNRAQLLESQRCAPICKEFTDLQKCIACFEEPEFQTTMYFLKCCSKCFPGAPVLELGKPESEHIKRFKNVYSDVLKTISIVPQSFPGQVSSGFEAVRVTLYPATQEEYNNIQNPTVDNIAAYHQKKRKKLSYKKDYRPSYITRIVSMIVANKPLTLLATPRLSKGITKVALQIEPIHGLQKWRHDHKKAWWLSVGGTCTLAVKSVQEGDWIPQISC